MTGELKLSWGRYPFIAQHAHSVEWQQDAPGVIQQLIYQAETFLPFGNGRSYGDSCLSASNHVVDLRSLNRFISFDVCTGILRTESGVTFEEILQLIIPKGWFLPVTPGTKFVTVGGAIGNDVHGKNHHVKGTFGRHVNRICLLRSDIGMQICSRTENEHLFSATIGGLGLTGVVLWAEIQLSPIASSFINTTTVRFNNIDEFLSLSQEYDTKNEYSVAWVDCTAKDKSLGRGIFVAGNHADDDNLMVHHTNKKNIPVNLPFSLVNKVTLKAFNFAYYHRHKYAKLYSQPGYDAFFYPLDGINNWNRIYGKKGFQQYQCVIPIASVDTALKEILKIIAHSNHGSFLAVLKRCGDINSPGLLSFPMPGISLALDFSHTSFINHKLFPLLDALVRNAGGRLYPAKDAHMSAKDFQHFYPQWVKLNALKDPMIQSHFWQRVTNE